MHICQHCRQELKFVQGRGWVHPEGGSYMMRCTNCGHKKALFPPPTSCPNCGASGNKWIDDHCVLAVENLKFGNSKIHLEIMIGDGICRTHYKNEETFEWMEQEWKIPEFVCGFHVPAAANLSFFTEASKATAFLEVGFFKHYRCLFNED